MCRVYTRTSDQTLYLNRSHVVGTPAVGVSQILVSKTPTIAAKHIGTRTHVRDAMYYYEFVLGDM